MNLESVNMGVSANALLGKERCKGVSDKEKSTTANQFEAFYIASQKKEQAGALPSENYGALIKNAKNCRCPYEYLADKNGIIEYNGIAFQCDTEHHALCLGDMSEPDNILTIPLCEGGVLKVNRESLGSLGKAIGMFSPQDVRRIMQAISIDAKIHNKKCEMEKEESDTFENLSNEK